jgi:hypothetical protein
MAPVNWRFRSGDRFELNANPTGERLVEPFEIADGIVIPPGEYHWMRYRVEVATAQKRRLYSQLTWWFGDFYNGNLDQIQWTGAWNPTPSSRWSSPANETSVACHWVASRRHWWGTAWAVSVKWWKSSARHHPAS